MFETSVVQARAIQSRGKYTLLTVSLIAHSAVIIGAIVIGIASVSFPKNAPDEFAIPLIPVAVTIPPPLGNPNATGQQKPPQAQPQQQKQVTAPLPTQPVAPPVVPDNVIPVDSASTGTESASSPATGVLGPIGVPWGTEGSPGEIDAPPAAPTQAPVEHKIYTVGEVKAPVILHRVEPLYPGVLQRARLNGKVSVHCVIDKNGRVRDAQVIYASNPAFGDSVLRALQQWRYQPASLRGEAVDCYLDLTVDFGVR